MPDLSILIPARNEMFLPRTVEDVLSHIEADTEIIVVLDGPGESPQLLPPDPRVRVIQHTTPIGQRAATNEAARLASGKFIMKLDAHCAVDQGFDAKLMRDCEPDWTVIPRMYNLHVFDWMCQGCGERTYQGPVPKECAKCHRTEFARVMVWQPRWNRKSDFARFDRGLHFQYWGAYGKRPESQGAIADLMCFVGACFFMRRERYWELGGLDERHGSWGQMGVEISCKSWLSGGRQVVNKNTWFAHLFRTQPGFGFPYSLSGEQVERARAHSRWLWEGGNWEKAKLPLESLITRFAPVPDWEEYEPVPKSSNYVPIAPQVRDVNPNKGIVFYTDNELKPAIALPVLRQLERSAQGLEIVSVSLGKPIAFGTNLHFDWTRGPLTMFKQILAGLEESKADIIFLTEHDILYHPSHFEFVPPRSDVFYYNTNVWKVRVADGHAVRVDFCQQTSGLCAHRALLLEHYRKRVERVEREGGYDRHIGFEPGTHSFPRGIDTYKAESWESAFPNLDLRHDKNLTPSRWSPAQFRNPRYAAGWRETDTELPGWGSIQEILHGMSL